MKDQTKEILDLIDNPELVNLKKDLKKARIELDIACKLRKESKSEFKYNLLVMIREGKFQEIKNKIRSIERRK